MKRNVPKRARLRTATRLPKRVLLQRLRQSMKPKPTPPAEEEQT